MAPPTKKTKGPSAYFIFAEEKRPEVMERLMANSENGKVAAPIIAKALGELWGSMGDEEKDAYRQKAKERIEAAAAAAAEGEAAAGGQEQEEEAADVPATAAAAAIPRHVAKRIMLTDDEVQRVGADALWMVAEAARIFVQQLAVKGSAAASAKKRRTIKLEDFEHVVRCDKRLVAAGLKDIVNNKRLFEANGVAHKNSARSRTPGRPGAAATVEVGTGNGEQPKQQQQQQQAAEGGDPGDAAGAGDQQQQGPELTDDELVALEEEKQKKAAELSKVRAIKAAERKKQRTMELAKSTHKITTFFVSSKPDQCLKQY